MITITNITPNTGPTSGSTRVLVRGLGLEPRDEYPNPVCKFGVIENIVKATYVTCTPKPRAPGEAEPSTPDKTDHCLQCDPGPGNAGADDIPFSVSITGDFTDCSNSLDFQYYKAPSVSHIIPIYGPKNGRTIITVYGNNFVDYDQYLRCSIGTKSVPAIYLSTTLLYCVAPASDVVVAAMPFRVTMNDQQSTPERIKYWYYPEPAIMKLNPDRGPLTGGNVVMIDGQHLDPFTEIFDEVDNRNDTYCRFGMDYVTPATVYTDILISCIAPPSPVIRTVLVDVTLNNADMVLNPQDWTDDHLPYTYYAPAYVFDVNPRVGPTSGNTTVLVIGSNFKDTGDIKCRFGSKVVSGIFISINEIKCISPPVANPGLVDLSISLVGDEFGRPVKYLYYETPFVERIVPICGPYTGYTQITVFGRNFVLTGPQLVKCIFGDIYTDATIMSDTIIKCDSPDIHKDEKLNKQVFFPVAVTLNGLDKSYSNSKITFGYYNPHHLTALSPARGPVTGRTSVTLTGEHFSQEGVCNVTIRYGTTEVNNTFYNDTTIVSASPTVRVPGDAIIQVALNGQQYTYYEGFKTLTGTSANLGGLGNDKGVVSDPSLPQSPADISLIFHFYPVPVVADFEPKSGPSSGNSTIILYGVGFAGSNETDVDLYVRFTDSVTNKLINVTKCYAVTPINAHCVTPPAPPNTKALLDISKNGQNYHPLRNIGTKLEDDFYIYYEAPRITNTDPKSGPVKPDEDLNVTITGTNFFCGDHCELARCRWGTHPYPIYTRAIVQDSKTIKCLIPQLSRPEVVEVEITLNDADYTQDHYTYSYFDAFVLDLSPHIGQQTGGTNITMYGFGFANTGDKLKCKFGSKENPILCDNHPCVFTAQYVSATEVRCTAPPQSSMYYVNSGQNVGDTPFPVEIAVDGSKFTSSGILYRFVELVEYKGISPRNGTANGGTFVIIHADFHWGNGTADGTNRLDVFSQYAIVKIKFSNGNETQIVSGDMISYPFHGRTSPNALACVTPPWSRAEQVKVYASFNGMDWSSPFLYLYEEKLDMVSISPACGVNQGETKVTIRGTGFKDLTNVHLRWGTETRPANLETLFTSSSGVLTAFSAPTPTNRTHGGYVYVEIGQDNVVEDVVDGVYTLYGESTRSKLLYYYYREPVVKYIYPHGGPSTGGTVVIVAGAWFLNVPAQRCTPKCRFGTIVVDGTFLTTVRVLCPAPAVFDVSRAVQVDVSFNGIDWTNSGQLFVYFNSPSISYISPINGPSTGGTMIALHGANFTGLAYPEEFMCRFRSLSLIVPDKFIPAAYKNDGLVYCTSPGGWGSGTAASVEVTFNGMDYTVSNSTFYFFQVDGVRPRSGPASGSPKGIEVYGSGFIQNPNASCFVNNTEYKPIKITWNSMICPMPAAQSGPDFYGTVPLEVTINGGDYIKLPRGFQYYPQPAVTSAEPGHGPASGGSIIALYGKGFRSDFEVSNLTCSIGPFIGTAVLVDANTVHCITPVMSQGRNETSLAVRLSLNGQDYTNNTNFYHIYGLLDSTPKGGPTTGGTQIIMRGFGFYDDHPKCRFGIANNNLVVPGKVLDDGHMACVSPGDFKVPEGAELPLDVPLEIGFSESKYNPWTRSDNKYRFYLNPKIKSFTPNSAYIDEKAAVVITSEPGAKSFFPAVTGWHNGELDMMHAIVCRFGEFGVVPATFVSPTQIKCLTPETKKDRGSVHSQTVYLEVALNGQDFVPAGEFTFKGTATGLWIVLMWLGIVVLCALIMVLLGLCCYWVWQNASMPKWDFSYFTRMNVQAGNALQAERPHVFRNPDGFMRPEGSPERPSFHFQAQT